MIICVAALFPKVASTAPTEKIFRHCIFVRCICEFSKPAKKIVVQRFFKVFDRFSLVGTYGVLITRKVGQRVLYSSGSHE